jgi:hypothetical protein
MDWPSEATQQMNTEAIHQLYTHNDSQQLNAAPTCCSCFDGLGMEASCKAGQVQRA